jgi:hypothetical protein
VDFSNLGCEDGRWIWLESRSMIAFSISGVWPLGSINFDNTTSEEKDTDLNTWTTPLVRCNKNSYLLTYSWSWALLEKLPIVQPLKKFPAFYGIWRFITVFTRALHWSLF